MESEVRLLEAHEGARIGCKFAFALTVQDLYQSIKTKLLSGNDGSCIKAATDDVIVVLKADVTDEKALYHKVREVCTHLNKGALQIGLSFTNDKAQILLPKDWHPIPDLLPPGVVVRSNTFADLAFRGMEVVGTAVGSSDFCQAFVSKTLSRMLTESKSLLQLHPQCATKLLKDCVCAAPAYLAQVCHPDITKEQLSKFDDRVWKLWVQVLGRTWVLPSIYGEGSYESISTISFE
jgi:hypothetical protein